MDVRSLSAWFAPGRESNFEQLLPLLDRIRVPRLAVLTAAKRPDSLTGDKALLPRLNCNRRLEAARMRDVPVAGAYVRRLLAFAGYVWA